MTGPVSPDPGEPRGLLGFYVAMGALLALAVAFASLWKPLRAWYRERKVTQALIRAVDRPIAVDMRNVPAHEALEWLLPLPSISAVVKLESGMNYEAKVTLQFKGAPAAAVLESWCAQVGAAWTIAPSGTAVDGNPKLQLIVSSRERIAELEGANPRIARMVRRYRRELAEKMAGAKGSETADGR